MKTNIEFTNTVTGLAESIENVISITVDIDFNRTVTSTNKFDEIFVKVYDQDWFLTELTFDKRKEINKFHLKTIWTLDSKVKQLEEQLADKDKIIQKQCSTITTIYKQNEKYKKLLKAKNKIMYINNKSISVLSKSLKQMQSVKDEVIKISTDKEKTISELHHIVTSVNNKNAKLAVIANKLNDELKASQDLLKLKL